MEIEKLPWLQDVVEESPFKIWARGRISVAHIEFRLEGISTRKDLIYILSDFPRKIEKFFFPEI